MYLRLPRRPGSTCQTHDRVPLKIHFAGRIGRGKGSIVKGRCINRWTHPKHVLCQCGGTRTKPATNATIAQMGILSPRKYGILEPGIPCKFAAPILSDQHWKIEHGSQSEPAKVLFVSRLLSSGTLISSPQPNHDYKRMRPMRCRNIHHMQRPLTITNFSLTTNINHLKMPFGTTPAPGVVTFTDNRQ